MTPAIHIFALTGLPEIAARDDLAALIRTAVQAQGYSSEPNDIFVVAQKIVSKAEARVVRLADIEPSMHARDWAEKWNKDARVVELVLRESKRIVRMERGIIISETHGGFVCANAGVDLSNADDGTAILLPVDPDSSARLLQEKLSAAFGVHVAVIISDTFGRAWREGLVNVALGVAGFTPLLDYRGQTDSKGRPLQATVIAAADELAGAAELVMGKADGLPVAIIRGLTIATRAGSGRDLIRAAENDLFR